MDLEKLFAQDDTAVEEGKWFNVQKDVHFKIASVNSERYQTVFRTLTKDYRTAIRRKTMDPEVMEEIMKKVAAKTLLLDWKGLELDGKPFPYNKDNALYIMMNFDSAYILVMDYASDMEAYKVQQEEDEAKNS